MRKALKVFLYLLFFLVILFLSTIKFVDRTPPQEQAHYKQMINRLDSLKESLPLNNLDHFRVGYAKVEITPDSAMALAGYGARKPKTFDGILDSVYIRTIVLETPTQKVAIISADLLIIHPLMTQKLHQQLKKTGWNRNNIFLTATHSHSSIGQWAPGLVGGLFAGTYDPTVAQVIADRMMLSLSKAEKNLSAAELGYSHIENPDLVLNRLVQERGIEDPFQKNVVFKTNHGNILFSSFSAHATCLTKESRMLSGDFPNYFHKQAKRDRNYIFSVFAAGPVASMGPETGTMDQFERTKFLGREIANRVTEPLSFEDSIVINSFRIPLELGKSQFKISKNLALRSYLFNYAFGEEPAEISVLRLGKILIVGTPCDFSGELAVPLYKYAEARGFELIITSFNGGYIGYITKDQWYDLEKYETRTMNWYGPGNGAYFSEIIEKTINALP